MEFCMIVQKKIGYVCYNHKLCRCMKMTDVNAGIKGTRASVKRQQCPEFKRALEARII